MEQAFRMTQMADRDRFAKPDITKYGLKKAEKVLAFHRSFPEYKETPLAELTCLAKELGVKSVFVKDESYRFGLNAFKVLGGSYAIGRWIARELGLKLEDLPYDRLVSPEISARLGQRTFITATDGNHGRGVAWTANRLKQNCVVYMPRGSAAERLNNIRALGAEAEILDCNYDEAVRRAAELAGKNGWVTVQDTAWEGYEDIPGWIMEGYTTLILEAVRQMAPQKPTHVFLQAGVGAMAGAVTAFLADYCGKDKPRIVIVEPNRADCLYRSAEAGTGERRFVSGEMHTIMAGLACGEPCTLAWEVLRSCAEYYLSVPEYAAADGMRILSSPLGTDRRIISGESGASGFGAACELLRNEQLKPLRDALGLNADSRVLCISTEGATDVANYRKIVWEGAWTKA